MRSCAPSAHERRTAPDRLDAHRQTGPHPTPGEGRGRRGRVHLRRLGENPHRVGKPLRRELEGLHSARRGDFRIIYRITDVVTIVAIDHRADIYRQR